MLIRNAEVAVPFRSSLILQKKEERKKEKENGLEVNRAESLTFRSQLLALALYTCSNAKRRSPTEV